MPSFSILTAIGNLVFILGPSLPVGTQVHVDNSGYLALQTFHRHNVPSTDMYGSNQLPERMRIGAPIYPQRDVLIGPIGAFNGAGDMQGGDINGKMIAVENLIESIALPWQADWYRTKVKQAKGKRIDDSFRLWFIDHAQHVSPVPTNTAALPARSSTRAYWSRRCATSARGRREA